MTGHLNRFVFLSLCLLLLSSCTQISMVEPTGLRKIGGVLQAHPGIQWNGLSDGNRELWTIDGFSLETLTFVTAIKDGQSLLPKGTKGDLPTFKKGMRATDVVDLYEASLSITQYSQIDTSGLRPLEISGRSAFRFDYFAFDATGLAKRGAVLGVIDDQERLNLVIFEAAQEHYFDKYIDKAESVLASVQLI